MVGRVFLVLTGACQSGHGVGGFTTNFIHSKFETRKRYKHVSVAHETPTCKKKRQKIPKRRWALQGRGHETARKPTNDRARVTRSVAEKKY